MSERDAAGAMYGPLLEDSAMAFSMIDKPGTKTGPCAKKCEHRDCAASRSEVEKICPGCSKPIGYGVAFTTVRDKADLPWTWHNLCAEIDAEKSCR